MPAVMTCPKCKTKFKLPDKLIGKAIKCSSCGTAFKTKAPADKSPAAANPQPSTAQPSTAELARLGLDGPLRRQPDVFAGAAPVNRQSPDLLGNLAADPGFAESQSAGESIAPGKSLEDSLGEFMQNPAVRTGKTKMRANGLPGKGGNKKSIPPFYKQIWFRLVVGFSTFFFLVMLVSLMAPPIGAISMMVFMGALGLASAIVAVWNLVQCCKSADSATEIILLFLVPFYIIYFWIKHWSSVWQSALSSLSFTLTIISCVALALLFALVCHLFGLEMPSLPVPPG